MPKIKDEKMWKTSEYNYVWVLTREQRSWRMEGRLLEIKEGLKIVSV